MKKIILDLKGIKEYQQNRAPYLLIDHATEVIQVSAKAIKILRKTNGFLKYTGLMTQICQECYKSNLLFKCVLLQF